MQVGDWPNFVRAEKRRKRRHSSRVVSQKVNFLGQGNKGGSSRLPLGEERANILLLACCYQEGWPRAALLQKPLRHSPQRLKRRSRQTEQTSGFRRVKSKVDGLTNEHTEQNP